MPNDFKKFIDTGGKSLDDIKKQIVKMLSKTAGNVVNDIEKEVRKEVKKEVRKTIRNVIDYTGKAEKIPPKQETRTVEIKLETEKPPDEIAYPHENLSENMSPHDIAVNEKIFGMRKQREVSHNGYIVQRCAEITFVMQGEYVKDVEDDFSRSAFFGMTTPMYASMSNSQLRTYFTWRTDVRRGVYRETDKSYVILYVYELLNKIGVHSSDEAFSKLLALWENMKTAKYLDDVLPRWLKDFYAYNNVSGEFPNIESKNENSARKSAVEISTGNFRDKLDFLADNSAYSIKESSFYSEKTSDIINGALEMVLGELSEYCKKYGITLDALICGQMKKDYSWRQFAGAMVNLDRMDGFRAVKINHEESYCIKRGEPALEEYSLSVQKGIIGFILKSVEARLRIRTGFGRKITVNPAMLSNDVKNRAKAMAAVENPEFAKTIERAVDKFCDKNGIFQNDKADNDNFTYKTQKVEIDVSKLSEIREQAEITAQKLMQDDSEFDENNIADDFENKAEQVSDDEFSEKISGYSTLTGEQSEWEILSGRLSDIERELLRVMYENGDGNEFCRERGLLSETVFEKINALALELTGDIIIENGELISDYRQDIAEIVFGD